MAVTVVDWSAAAVANRASSEGLVPHVCHAPKNFELPRRAGPHLLDRLLDRVQRRGIGGTGHVVTQNPASGEEPGEMPRASAVQQLFVFDLDHPSRWKSCGERPTPLKCSRLCIFGKGNDDYEKA